MDTQANKTSLPGKDPRNAESQQDGCMVGMPSPIRGPGPYAEAINELRIVHNNRRCNHGVALREERYSDAADHNAYSKSILKAIILLEAANDAVR